MTEKKQHKPRHPYSPSKIAALEKCPCFKQEQDGNNEAADRGTRLHEAIEHEDPQRVADEQDRDQVLQCILHKQQIVAKYPNAEVYEEKQISSSLNYGTADLVLLDFDSESGIIVDWKMGVVPVEHPERNIQLWSYAYALFSEYPELHYVHVYVSQPQVQDDMSYYKMGRDMIEVTRQRVERIIRRAEDPNKVPTPSDSGCQYCTSKGNCSALRQVSLQPFTQHYGITVPPNVQLGIDYGAQTVGQVYAFAALLEDFAKQLKKETALQAEELSKQGQKIEGVTLVHRKGNLKVVDKAQLLYLLDGKKLIYDTLETCCTISAKKVSELLKDTCGDDPVQFIEKMEAEGTFERNKASIYLKKQAKTDLKQMLKGEL